MELVQFSAPSHKAGSQKRARSHPVLVPTSPRSICRVLATASQSHEALSQGGADCLQKLLNLPMDLILHFEEVLCDMRGVASRHNKASKALKSSSPNAAAPHLHQVTACKCACQTARAARAAQTSPALQLAASAGEVMSMSAHTHFDLACFVTCVQRLQGTLQATVLPVHAPRMYMQLQWQVCSASAVTLEQQLLAQRCIPRPCTACSGPCSRIGSEGVLGGACPTLLRRVSCKFSLAMDCKIIAADSSSSVFALDSPCACAGGASAGGGREDAAAAAPAPSTGWQTMELLFTPRHDAHFQQGVHFVPFADSGASQLLTPQLSSSGRSCNLTGRITGLRASSGAMLSRDQAQQIVVDVCLQCAGSRLQSTGAVTAVTGTHAAGASAGASVHETPWGEASDASLAAAASQAVCNCSSPHTMPQYAPLTVLLLQPGGEGVWWQLGPTELRRMLAGIPPNVVRACLSRGATPTGEMSPRSSTETQQPLEAVRGALDRMLDLLFSGKLPVQAYVQAEATRHNAV